jgi:cyclohexyl-isocyanide hydratase
MVLGAAGLLRGYKATSHWPVRDILPQLGAELAVNRVVQDRSAA